MGRVTRRYLLGVVGATVLLTLLAGLTPLANLLAKPLVDSESPTAADAIVVLGGGVSKFTGEPTRASLERIASGAALWREGKAPTVVFTGGTVPGNRYNEARAAEPIFAQLGIPESQLILEDQARNTRENAENAKKLATERGWARLLVVTSPFHTRRSCRVFSKLDMTITCVAADPTLLPPTFFDRLNDVRSVVREYGATIYFALKGYL